MHSSELPREIVPNINRLAAALRAAGGAVAWVQATYTREGPGYWPLFFDYMVSAEMSVDTVLIAGTMTNVCCEASARATMAQFIGDVRSTDEVIGLLK